LRSRKGQPATPAPALDFTDDVFSDWASMPEDDALGEGAVAPPPGNARKSRTRQLLLIAGREVLTDPRFDSPRVQDVARMAGVSRAAFYLHFSSLDELIKVVFSREARWQLRRYRELTAGIALNSRKLRGWLERMFASFRSERQYIHIINRGLAINPAYLGLIHRERNRMVAQLGRRIPELGVFDDKGALDQERFIELRNLTTRIDELSAHSAFDAWEGDFDMALDICVRAFGDFVAKSSTLRPRIVAQGGG